MTKFLVLLVVWLAAFPAGAAEDNANKEVKFKNPIFYEKMDALSESTNPVRITPNFIEFDMKNDGSAKGPCELLENEDDYITVKCIVVYPDGDEDKYKLRYTIEGCWMEEKPFCDLIIREDLFDSRGIIQGEFPDEKISGQFWYIVEQPKK